MKEIEKAIEAVIRARDRARAEHRYTTVDDLEEALSALETEKPTEDIKKIFRKMLRDIRNIGYEQNQLFPTPEGVNERVKHFQHFAETYHEQKCKECKNTGWTTSETPPDGEYIVKVKNERGEVFIMASFCEDGQWDDILATHVVIGWKGLPDS